MKVGLKVADPMRGADVASALEQSPLATLHWVVSSPFHPMKRLSTGDWSVQLRARRKKHHHNLNTQAQLSFESLNMQAEKYADAASPELHNSDESGSESGDTTSEPVKAHSKRKAKGQGKQKCSKKLAVEPAAAVKNAFTCE